MKYLVDNLLNFFGVNITDLYTFSELLTWFVTVIIGVELVLFVLDGVFYAVRNIARGIR